jgi:hypothetical protein
MRIYQVGETIQFVVHVTDVSGVAHVYAHFAPENPGQPIQMSGDGAGHSDATVTLSYQVTNDNASGIYHLNMFHAVDSKGNVGQLPTENRGFIIGETTGDTEGPELVSAEIT